MIVISTTLTSASAGLSITLLCARLNRRNQESKESAADVVHNTLRCEDIIFREIAEFPEYIYSGCKSVCNEDDNICRSRHRPEYVHSPQARIPWHWSWCDGGGGRSVTSHVTRDTSQGGGVVMSTGHCLSSWFIFSGSLGPSVAPSLAIIARLAAANHITPE